MLCDVIHHLTFMDTQDQTAVLQTRAVVQLGAHEGPRGLGSSF